MDNDLKCEWRPVSVGLARSWPISTSILHLFHNNLFLNFSFVCSFSLPRIILLAEWLSLVYFSSLFRLKKDYDKKASDELALSVCIECTQQLP